MKAGKLGAWLIFAAGATYFLLPLLATLEFSLRKRLGTYSLDAYAAAFADGRFQQAFGYSVIVALLTIVIGVVIIVPAVYFVRLRMPWLRPFFEFVTLLPLVIPAITLVFGYLRLYNSSSFLPLTSSAIGTDILLTFGYATLALPYMYRAVDTGMRTIDATTLTEAATSLGAGTIRILGSIILPNILVAIVSGAFLTFAIVIGEFTITSLLSRPGFGPYLVDIGTTRPYESAALSVIAFLLTWAAMGMIQLVGRFAPKTAPRT